MWLGEREGCAVSVGASDGLGDGATWNASVQEAVEWWTRWYDDFSAPDSWGIQRVMPSPTGSASSSDAAGGVGIEAGASPNASAIAAFLLLLVVVLLRVRGG